MSDTSPVRPAAFSAAATLLPALLQLLPNGVVLYAPLYEEAGQVVDFRLAYLNPAAQRLLALPEQPTATLLTLYPGAREAGLFAFYSAAFASGQPEHYPVNGLLEQGSFHYVAQRSGEWLLVSLTDPHELAHAAVADNLRQRQAQAQAVRLDLEAERRQLREVLARLPAQVATYRGPDYVYDFVNARYQDYFPGHEFVGFPLLQTVAQEVDTNGLLALFQQVYHTGESYHHPEQEVWLTTHGRTQPQQYFLSFTLLPLRDAQGQVNGLLDFSYDVTAQVQARRQVDRLNQELETRVQERTRQLTAQQVLLQQILQDVPAYLATLSGPEHRYSFFNTRYQELAAGRVGLGRRVSEVVPEAEEQGFLALLDQVYASGSPFVGQEMPLHLPAPGAPATRYLNFVYQPLVDEQHRTTGILVFCVDVTEQVVARQRVQTLNEELAILNEKLATSNEQLHEANRQLTRTNVDLDNFIYTASHDLKAPISNIEGLLLALEDELPAAARTGDISSLLTMMQESIERFTRTIHQLTELSRLQKGHDSPQQTIALAAVVQAVCLDLAPLVQQTQARVEVAIPADLVVLFSEKNLRSVVYNLLSNALKYRHADRLPVVRISGRTQEGYQLIEVQDNGLGLDLTQGQEPLFAMFQRLHTHVEGTGIGLYMVKKIVENGGGRITVESQLGHGTTFRVYLPC